MSQAEKNVVPESIYELSLSYLLVALLLGGMFFWCGNAYTAVWARRFCIGLSGLVSLLLLFIRKKYLVRTVHWKLIAGLLVISTVALLSTSSLRTAIIGKPIVHPGLLSLYSSVLIGLALSTYNRNKLLVGSYMVICGWAAFSFIFWCFYDVHARLGFLDTQIIYAACLFAIGILIGLKLYTAKLLHKKFIISSLAFLAVCLLLSQTRSALILFGLVLVIEYRLLLKKYFKHSLVALCCGILLVGLLGGYFSRLTSPSYFVTSVKYRLNLIQAGLPPARNLLLGDGVGSIERNIHNNGHSYPLLAGDVQRGVRFESSHNYYADLVIERGFVVAGLFIYILVISLRRLGSVREDRLFPSILLFLALFIAVNNINLQIEIMIWSAILLSASSIVPRRIS